MKPIECRFCGTSLSHCFVDLGMSPLSNAYLKDHQLQQMEPFYPLKVYVCETCMLVQLPEWQAPENIFYDYSYFSSFSDTWLKHARDYSEAMMSRFGYGRDSHVVEIASNDGYLLQYFISRSVPVLGIEPAKNVAMAAIELGIPTLVAFFGSELANELAAEGKHADLIIGNNVLAHVPNLNDFVQGARILLKNNGVITMEFPHLMRLVEDNQFDTIYHEHFSYFSFITVEKVFKKHGLTIFDVEELPTHGGSLRIYARHCEDYLKPVEKRVSQLREREKNAGLTRMEYYRSFGKKVRETKWNILDFLIKAKTDKKSIVGYGAPAKGNTLLNYCGVRSDFIEYTVDKNPHKQGQFLPGTHLPIYHPDKIRETQPDIVLILPWNLKEEIISQVSFIRQWGGKFAVLIPSPMVYTHDFH